MSVSGFHIEYPIIVAHPFVAWKLTFEKTKLLFDAGFVKACWNKGSHFGIITALLDGQALVKNGYF